MLTFIYTTKASSNNLDTVILNIENCKNNIKDKYADLNIAPLFGMFITLGVLSIVLTLIILLFKNKDNRTFVSRMNIMATGIVFVAFLGVLIASTVLYFQFFSTVSKVSDIKSDAKSGINQVMTLTQNLQEESSAALNLIENQYYGTIRVNSDNTFIPDKMMYVNQISSSLLNIISIAKIIGINIDTTISVDIFALISKIKFNYGRNDYSSFINDASELCAKLGVFQQNIKSLHVFLSEFNRKTSKLTDKEISMYNMGEVMISIYNIFEIINKFNEKIDNQAVTAERVSSSFATLAQLNQRLLPNRTFFDMVDFFTKYVIKDRDILNIEQMMNQLVPNLKIDMNIKSFFDDIKLVLSALGYVYKPENTLQDVLEFFQNKNDELRTLCLFWDDVFKTLETNDFSVVNNLFDSLKKVCNMMQFNEVLQNATSVSSALSNLYQQYFINMKNKYNDITSLIEKYDNSNQSLVDKNTQMIKDFNEAQTNLVNAGFSNIEKATIFFSNLILCQTNSNNWLDYLYDLNDNTNRNKSQFMSFLDQLNPTELINSYKKLSSGDKDIDLCLLFINNLIDAVSSSAIVHTVLPKSSEEFDVIFPAYNGGNPLNINTTSGNIEIENNDIVGYLSLIENFYKNSIDKFNNINTYIKSSTFKDKINTMSNIVPASEWVSAFTSYVTDLKTNVQNESFAFNLALADNPFSVIRKNLYVLSYKIVRASMLTYPIKSKEQSMLLNNNYLSNINDFSNIYSLDTIVNYPQTYSVDGNTYNVMSSLTGAARHNALAFLCFSTWYKDSIISKWLTDNNINYESTILDDWIQIDSIKTL